MARSHVHGLLATAFRAEPTEALLEEYPIEWAPLFRDEVEGQGELPFFRIMAELTNEFILNPVFR